jgi:tetratricopeptide (TPR) repeat protein
MAEESDSPSVEEESKEYKKALLFIKSGAFDKARELLEEYCAINPRSSRAFNKLAFVQLELGNLPAAEDVLVGLLESGKRDFYTHFLYGRLLMRRGDLTNSIAHFTTALSINPQDSYTLNAVAEALELQGDVEKAVRCLRKAISVAPGDTLGYLNLGKLYLSRSDWENAAATVDAGLAKVAKDPELHFLKGKVILGKGDRAGAEKHYEELTSWYPGQAWGKMGTGLVKESQGDLTAAIRELALANSADPRNLLAAEHLARIYSATGDREKALVTMERALGMAPHDMRIITLYARALYERHLVLKCWLRLHAVLDQEPNFAPARILMATIYLDENMPGKAEEQLKDVLERDPGDADALVLRAEAKALMNQPNDAEALAKRVIEELGTSRDAQLVLALVARARGDAAGFKAQLEQINAQRQTDRADDRARFYLGKSRG